MLFDSLARPDSPDFVTARELIARQLDRRKDTHAAGTEGPKQRAVLKLAYHAR
jgi:hypothetical protein